MLWLFVPVCNQIICIHHNTLWPLQKRSNSIFARFVSILDAIFLKKCADAHLVVSERIAQQLSVKGIATPATITRFKPLFNATVFRQPAHEKPRRKGELHLLYSGRIERDKGVLDLLMAMNWLRQHTDCQIRLVIAGTGSFEQAARDFCKESGIDSQVIFTGQISGEILQRHYAEADLLVAPTQSTFSEGYAMVIPEAILAGTGAIASTVVPAADDFSACILTVEADNYDMLGKTILSTINTENHHVLSMHTMTYRDTILDASKSLRNIVGRTLRTKDIQV
jgi:glycosyltransferase involved in cell wall biosynthesis